MSYFASLKQSVIVPGALQHSGAIAPSATWSSGYTSTLDVAGIQPNLQTDQNCLVYVDQSSDGINADAGSDMQLVYAGASRARGWTVQATSAYVQLRVVNLSTTAAANVILCTALCPIVEAVPRSLSARGNLLTAVYEIEGEFGTKATISPMHALKVAQAVRLVGTALFSPLSPQFWASTLVGSGTVTQGGGQVTLATGVVSGSSAVLNSARTARYIGGACNYLRVVGRVPAVVGANVRALGVQNAALTDGFFFEFDSAVGFSVCAKKASAITRVTSGAFNGSLGPTYIPDTNVHTGEVFWTNSSVWFLVDGELLHRISGSTAPLTNTLDFRCWASNVNGANINNNTLEVRTMTINRLGHLVTQPTSAFVNTLTTTVYKNGPGNLHRLIVGTPPSTEGTLTLYDNTAASGAVLDVQTYREVAAGRPQPYAVDYGGLPFYTGLTAVTAGAIGNLTLVFE